MTVLTIYIRHGCHLCEDMLAQIHSYKEKYVFELEIVDIERNSALIQKYGDKVPVLSGKGVELCHYFLDAVALQQYFDTARNPLE